MSAKKLIYAEDLKDAFKYGWVNDKFVLRTIDEAPAVEGELMRWRKFEFREPTEEEKADHPDWGYVMENVPDDGEEILVSNGIYVWKDEFCDDGVECYLDSGRDMEDCWWMPMPQPPKGE